MGSSLLNNWNDVKHTVLIQKGSVKIFQYKALSHWFWRGRWVDIGLFKLLKTSVLKFLIFLKDAMGSGLI